MITVLTMLRGSEKLTNRWAGLYSLEGSGTKLVTSYVTEYDKKESEELGAVFTKKVRAYNGSSESARVHHIAGILGSLLDEVDTPEVLIWDDDIVPPRRAISQISKSLEGAPMTGGEVAGIVSVIPFRGYPDSSDLIFNPFGVSSFQNSIPASGLHRVWGGGTGFSLWRTEAIRDALPLEPVQFGGSVYGWDRDLAEKLQERGLITLADGSLRCDHDNLTD